MPGGAPGIYRFKAKLSMAGGWALSLGAKVQGEKDTVQGKLLLKPNEPYLDFLVLTTALVAGAGGLLGRPQWHRSVP